jgi:hypothetical protein
VIIEQVAILDKAARPSPNDVEMLRFIGVKTIPCHVYDSDDDHEREKNCRSDAFSGARHFEITVNFGGTHLPDPLPSQLPPESDDLTVSEARPHPASTTTIAIIVVVNGMATLSRRALDDADLSHQVDIQTASADTMLIHNGSSAARAGNVTLIW